MESMPPAVESWSLNHKTTREVPQTYFQSRHHKLPPLQIHLIRICIYSQLLFLILYQTIVAYLYGFEQ